MKRNSKIFSQTKLTRRACSFCTELTLFLQKPGFYNLQSTYFIMEHGAGGTKQMVQ